MFGSRNKLTQVYQPFVIGNGLEELSWRHRSAPVSVQAQAGAEKKTSLWKKIRAVTAGIYCA